MAKVGPQLSRLYQGTFLFGLACGISIALTSLYLDGKGFSKEQIGTLALFFASGLVLFALPVGVLLRRFSGKRTLTVMLLGYAFCVGAFPFMDSYASIAGIRFLDGVFSVGVWVSSETLLLSRTDEEHKAYLTSLYAVWLASGYVVGPVLAMGIVQVLPIEHAFLIASAFGLISSLYLGLRLPPDAPGAHGHAHVETTPNAAATASEPQPSAASLLWRIKTSCFGAFSYGYFQASVVLFLPLFMIESKGIARENTVVLPGIFCFGMLVCSNAAGRLADKIGHLRVITWLSALGTLCVLGFVFLDTYWIMCIAVFGAGATFASMSPVALALTGVVTEARHLSRANSIYNVFYASGMLLGPPLTSQIFARWGGPAMLYHLSALWVAFVLFCVVFFQDDPNSKRKSARDLAPTSAA